MSWSRIGWSQKCIEWYMAAVDWNSSRQYFSSTTFPSYNCMPFWSSHFHVGFCKTNFVCKTTLIYSELTKEVAFEVGLDRESICALQVATVEWCSSRILLMRPDGLSWRLCWETNVERSTSLTYHWEKSEEGKDEYEVKGESRNSTFCLPGWLSWKCAVSGEFHGAARGARWSSEGLRDCGIQDEGRCREMRQEPPSLWVQRQSSGSEGNSGQFDTYSLFLLGTQADQRKSSIFFLQDFFFSYCLAWKWLTLREHSIRSNFCKLTYFVWISGASWLFPQDQGGDGRGLLGSDGRRCRRSAQWPWRWRRAREEKWHLRSVRTQSPVPPTAQHWSAALRQSLRVQCKCTIDIPEIFWNWNWEKLVWRWQNYENTSRT